MKAVPSLIGSTIKKSLTLNFLCVPRFPDEAIGALINFTKEN
jgi:hypothetical protein